MRWGIALLLVSLSFLPTAFAMGDQPDTTESTPMAACAVGGCSGQLCGEASAEPMVSTCEWRASYACYGKHSTCERQADGACGWSPTPALQACLATADHTGPVTH